MNGFFYWSFGAIFGAAMLSLVMQTKAKAQATKDNQAQVELHIERQRALGERMIGDSDKPRPLDLLVTAAAAGLIIFGTFKGWW